MASFLKLEEKDGLGILTLDYSGEMNVLGREVLEELDAVLDTLMGRQDLKGLVFTSGKKGQFIAGADIKVIESFTSAEEATEGARQMEGVVRKFSKLPFPTVAAIDGPCLGGGLELALCCSWRIVTESSKTKLGLPEIQLGLIPGAGGTQRLPRLIGIQPALDLILTGKRLNGKRALKLGLVDAVVPTHLLMEEAAKWATKKRGREKVHFSLGKDLPKWATEGTGFGRKIVYKKAKEMVDDKTKGFYPASYKALTAVFDGYEKSLEDGLKLESQLFGELCMTRESKSLVHLFHATTQIKKHPYRDAGRERFGSKPVQSVGVVGAGFMGAGIAIVHADKEIRVRLSDPSKEAVGRAQKQAVDYFNKKLQRRRLKTFDVERRMAHISPGLTPAGFNTCDVVIEAVFEDLELKQKILTSLEENRHDDWIFASNTSAIPISKIASVSKYPERVVGMHYFSPVEKMPLLEVIATEKSADWAVARAIELGQITGKQVIVVKDSPGFYTTRALAFFLAEATHILLEGTHIEMIDRALVEFGFPVGPITLIDEVGIDVGVHVLETISEAYPDRMVMPGQLEKIVDSGRLGRKNGKGLYTYHEGRKQGPDESIRDVLGISPEHAKEITAEEIVDRCLLVFVNESIRCLEESILPTAFDGDVGAVFGLGFPPFWGGPFKYTDLVGAATVVNNLERLEKEYGERFKPCDLLRKHAEEGLKFFPNEKD